MAHFLAYWKTYADYGFEKAKRHVCTTGYGSPTFKDVNEGDTVWVVGSQENQEWRLLQRLFATSVYIDSSTSPERTRVVAHPDKSAFFELDKQGDLAGILTQLEFESGKQITSTGAAIGMSIQSVRRLNLRDADRLVNYSGSVLNDTFQNSTPSTAQEDSEEPRRQMLQMNQIIRNPHHVKYLKELYKHKCQVCGETIQLPGDRLYSEVHHIKPLGGTDPGPDRPENMICVCPNCHVRLDFGAISLDRRSLTIDPSHKILDEYIEYHNISRLQT